MAGHGADGGGFGDEGFVLQVPELDLDLDMMLPEGSPEPMLWRVLVIPLTPKTVTDGGILLTSETQQNQKMINYIGKVAKVGSMAYQSHNTKGESDPPKVGDYVIFGRYAGVRIEYKGVPMVIVADDDIIAKAVDPTGYRIYV